MTKPFRFKQFSIVQEQAAMKLGFDAILLGAWVQLNAGEHRLLDVGAGMGILSLMLAQRYEDWHVDAIEIDEAAQQECAYNFAQSPWAERLHAQHGNFFNLENNIKYQHIISNPPFFAADVQSPNAQRMAARQASAFPLGQWLAKAKELLAEGGQISFIYPYASLAQIEEQMQAQCLYLQRCCQVSPQLGAPPHRLMVTLAKEQSTAHVLPTKVAIRQGANYSPEFAALSQAFYLQL